MKKTKLLLLPLILALVMTQFALVSAAPPADEIAPISGTVQKITVVTDPNTGESTVWVLLVNAEGEEQQVHINQAAALELGLVVYDENDILVPHEEALGWEVEIPTSAVIPEEEEARHPVGNALATFFASIPGVDYEAIMSAHEQGYGFGVIAQGLWLTQKMEGDAEFLGEILKAKDSGDYSYFAGYFDSEEESLPTNWGQFRKALLAGDKKQNLGTAMSAKDKEKDKIEGQGNAGNNGNGGGQGNAGQNDEDKTNHGNNGNSGNNGNPGNNGNQGNNGNRNEP